MHKNDADIVRLAGQYVFELFRNANADCSLVYHGFTRSRELVDACKEIAKGCKLDDDAERVVLLSAWFHDAGYAVASDGDRAKSIEAARKFLADRAQPESLADAVASCLEAIADGHVPDAPAHEVLHDGLLARLANKNYLEEAALLRLEEERRNGKSCSDPEWIQGRIEYFHAHPYRTLWAQREYNGQRAKNLLRLDKLRKKEIEEREEPRADEAKLSKNVGRTIESLYDNVTRNQIRLVAIADHRTSTMLHVNAIMISLTVALVLRRLDEQSKLMVPTVVLLCVNLAVVVLSILSMRSGAPKLRGRGSEEGRAHEANVLELMNVTEVSLPAFLAHIRELAADAPALQRSYMECIYFGRKYLIQRKKALQLTYDIFICGLAGALLLFVLAMVRN
jgi:predicted metal-dependent HD superfamily phosphohydrolase